MPREFTVRLQGPAERFYRQAPDHVRKRVDEIFTALQVNPFVDNFHKFHYTRLLPGICTAWVDDDYIVVYQLVEYSDPEEHAISVVAIRRRLDHK